MGWFRLRRGGSLSSALPDAIAIRVSRVRRGIMRWRPFDAQRLDTSIAPPHLVIEIGYSKRASGLGHARHELSGNFGLRRGTPIDRRYVEAFLKRNSGRVSGDCLAFGDAYYLDLLNVPRSHQWVIGLNDGLPAERALHLDIQAVDALPESAFSTIICTHVLNFVPDLDLALLGLWRMLRPGGQLLLTVAGLTSVSEYDELRWGDYWRFTPQGLANVILRSPLRLVGDVATYGNAAAACLELVGAAAEDVPASILWGLDERYPVVIGAAVVRVGS